MSVRHDAHVHMWPEHVPHPERLPAAFGGVGDLLESMDRLGVGRAAVITPRAMGWDDDATLAVARAHPDRFVAVVRYDVTDRLAPRRLSSAIDRGARGVRITTDDGSLSSFARADEFWELVVAAGIAVAVNTTPGELEVVDALAATHPDVTIVLDHAGRPDVAAGVDGADFVRVLGLADRDNVVVKTPNVPYFSLAGPPFSDLDVFMRAVIGRFGAERVLLGSDWPLCAVDHDYAASIDYVDRVARSCSPGGAELVLAKNFERVYGDG